MGTDQREGINSRKKPSSKTPNAGCFGSVRRFRSLRGSRRVCKLVLMERSLRFLIPSSMLVSSTACTFPRGIIPDAAEAGAQRGCAASHLRALSCGLPRSQRPQDSKPSSPRRRPLHHFEYEYANEKSADPGANQACDGVWGEAMTYTRPVAQRKHRRGATGWRGRGRAAARAARVPAQRQELIEPSGAFGEGFREPPRGSQCDGRAYARIQDPT